MGPRAAGAHASAAFGRSIVRASPARRAWHVIRQPFVCAVVLLPLIAACGDDESVRVAVDVNRRATPVARGDEPRRRGIGDRRELEAYLDGLMAGTLRDRRIAGATLAIVKDDALFLTKGYGYADVERQRPVDPQRTLFRIGSVTKLFTATAIMQLLEAGKVDLDVDVNRYLDFAIPETYPTAVTLTHLLTHTAGFEDDGRDLWARDEQQIQPLGRWLATHMPERVRMPGTYAAYSNYGTALAGYVVERVSGFSWNDYIERHILAPLGMTRTTGRQPLPAQFRADMSQGYRSRSHRFEPKRWETLMGASPAGSISATATDMAAFMIAHLGRGVAGGGRVLGEATAARMHARAFAHDPRLPGLALGFYEKSSHGLRIIGHSGNTQWFHTDLALIPSERIGLFVSYNTDTAAAVGAATLPFLREFLDRYYPAPPPHVTAAADAPARARRVAGEYRFNRMSYTTFQKAFGLVGPVRIRAQADGSLHMRSPLGAARLLPVGPRLYQEERGTDMLAFEADASAPMHAFVASLPMMALERVPWDESTRLHWIILGAAFVTFAAIGRAALDRRIRRADDAPKIQDELPGRSLLMMLAVTNLAFVVCFVLVMADPVTAVTHPARGVALALALALASATLTVATVAAAVRHWTNGLGTHGARLRYDAVVIVALLFLWSLSRWNLLGWSV